MKSLIITTLLFVIGCNCYGQLAWNKNLMLQLQKNQLVRMSSENFYRKNYKEQYDLYQKINKNIAQVLVVNEMIYKNLTNVNEALKQGKRLEYFYKYINKIRKNTQRMLALLPGNIHFSVVLIRPYTKLLEEAIGLYNEVKNSILREDKDFIIDPYDREILIDKMLQKARLINGYILHIISQLEAKNRISFLERIPILGNYISLDKEIVNNIIWKWNRL